jgi:hypothetical protein
MAYEERTYRKHVKTDGLVSFTVMVKETDVLISASRNLEQEARDAVVEARFNIEEYIKRHPEFLSSLSPLPYDETAPDMVKEMLRASASAGVGPMASVAGAVAEYVGKALLTHCDEIIVENGGDIFIKVNREITVSIFAGESPLSNRIGLRLSSSNSSTSICTSSGTIGPSLSFGTADAVTILSSSAFLADAAATAVGNTVKSAHNIQKAIDAGKQIPQVDGILIIKDEHMGVWGNINLVRL